MKNPILIRLYDAMWIDSNSHHQIEIYILIEICINIDHKRSGMSGEVEYGRKEHSNKNDQI